MPSIPEAAQEHYRLIQALQLVGLRAARRAWSRLEANRVEAAWLEQIAALLPVIDAAQARAAFEGATYSAMTIAQQGTYIAPAEFTDPNAFAGYASDGRTMSTLLTAPASTTAFRSRQGMSARDALAAGGFVLDRIIQTQIADAARQAAGADITARTGAGYVRMLNPPSCSRCTILAGRFYRWNNGFLRHPNCFPAGVLASGPAVEGATRRWFEGELVVLSTASGQKLPLTGNHPVLTRRGWIPANLLQEGDEVFRSPRPEGATPLVSPDHHQMPALVEDVWGSLAVDGLDRVPSTPKDFHGDGQRGKVDVVRADRSLSDRRDAVFTQHLREELLAIGVDAAGVLDAQRVPELLDLRSATHPSGAIRGSGLPLPLRGSQAFVADRPGFGDPSSLDARLGENPRDRSARNSVLLGESVLAGAVEVLLDDLIVGQDSSTPRWDAPNGPLTLESADGYATQGRDLLERLAGQVEVDRLVEVRRVEWSGHVYSLTSSEGWHTANSLIVSNCDCVHVATALGSLNAARTEGLVDDPYKAFSDLSAADQDRIYTKAGARAIRDGADIRQVVNSRRGMTPNGYFTSEGTTKLGNASKGLKRGQRRLTPEAIYEQTERFGHDRDWALERLKEHGYILQGGQTQTGLLRGAREGYGQLGSGGQRRAAREAIDQARVTGVRDPRSRYTMTAAERRLYDAERRYETALSGWSPYTSPGFGQRPDPYGLDRNRGGVSRRPVTPVELAIAEKEYRAYLASGGQIFDR